MEEKINKVKILVKQVKHLKGDYIYRYTIRLKKQIFNVI
jgi:hypothetical protein